ncbi:MAG: hypothetical protein K8T26_00075 [Lentisphaerae bacterium]|nr:hypothetical protein [Lentisphaerota bacterium]
MHHGIGFAQLVATGLLWAVVGAFFSHAARRGLRLVPFGLVSSISSTLMAACLCDWAAIRAGGLPALSAFVPIIVLGGFLNTAGTQLIMAAMRRGHQAGSWTVAQSAMVVPFLAGVTFWHERPSVLNMLGVLLIVSSIALFGRRAAMREHRSESHAWFGFALLAFVMIGMSQTLLTVPSHWPGWSDAGRLRVPLVTSSAALALGVGCAFRREWPGRREIVAGLGCSLVGVTGSVLAFAGMDNLATAGLVSLVYPLAVGTCIVGFGLNTRFRMREPLGRAGAVALLCGVAGILLLGIK